MNKHNHTTTDNMKGSTTLIVVIASLMSSYGMYLPPPPSPPPWYLVGDNWELLGNEIDGDVEGDKTGFRVSLSADGSVVAISAPGKDGTNVESGSVQVYRIDQNFMWIPIGDAIDGENEDDYFGSSVSLSADGSTVAIGADRSGGSENGGSLEGYVRVYRNENDAWTKLGDDIDGESVSLNEDGTIVAIGSPQINKVRVYNQNENGAWTLLGYDIAGGDPSEKFGRSVSLSADGKIVAIGDPERDHFTGHMQVYEYRQNSWFQIGNDIYGDAEYNNFDSQFR